MEFKRFKRKGLIFNNNSIGLGLEVRLGNKLKVFRIERSNNKDDETFDFAIFDGPKTIDGAMKNEMVAFLEKNNSEYLPPESLNGYPIGTSFRSNTRLQYFLNRSVSMIFTLNTIDDSRYDNFITFRGEIRAHF